MYNILTQIHLNYKFKNITRMAEQSKDLSLFDNKCEIPNQSSKRKC